MIINEYDATVGKTYFRPLNKNNTGMAALRAGLPVIMYNAGLHGCAEIR